MYKQGTIIVYKLNFIKKGRTRSIQSIYTLRKEDSIPTKISLAIKTPQRFPCRKRHRTQHNKTSMSIARVNHVFSKGVMLCRDSLNWYCHSWLCRAKRPALAEKEGKKRLTVYADAVNNKQGKQMRLPHERD